MIKTFKIFESVKSTNSENQSIINPENFWKWFNGSKIVDSNGNPLVVYHGTNQEFNEFKNKVGKRGGFLGSRKVLSKTFFFTDDFYFAEKASYVRHDNFGGKSRVISAYLKMKNPLDFSEMTEKSEDLFKKYTNDYPHEYFGYTDSLDQWWRLFDGDEDDITELVKADGYDGVILAEEVENGTTTVKSYGVFNSNQIKSINNSGEYNNSPNINENQLQLFPTEEYFLLKHKEDFLYHVSNIRNLDSIKKYGIIPDFGETVRKFYSDYYLFDKDEEDDNEEEKFPIYDYIEGVSFFSESPLLGFCTPGIGLCDVKWENMVLCIVRKNDTIFHKLNNDKVTDFEGDYVDVVGNLSVHNLPNFIEGGDWFSFQEQTPEYILHGEKLKKFIKTNFPEKTQKYALTEKFSLSPKKRWYHYSNVDYLKINLFPSHRDPAGFYMFPDDVTKKINSWWKSRKYKFILSVNPNVNILNLDKLTGKQEMEIIKKLKRKDQKALNSYMNYKISSSFWNYIQDIYSGKPALARKEFMDLGYDGIYSKDRIHSLEPQLIIFDKKNLNIEKIEKKSSPYKDLIRIKDFVMNYLKNFNDLKVSIHNSTKTNVYNRTKQVGFFITVEKDKKSFSIDVYYELSSSIVGLEIWVHIHPYDYKNYSVATNLNYYKPNWVDFEENTRIKIENSIREIE